MTPTQKIKREILLQVHKVLQAEVNQFREIDESEAEFLAEMEDGVTEETIERQYALLTETDCEQEYEEEFRCSGIPTGLPTHYSRHYEAKEVAKQLQDGSWVGWTYYYGGGKHGEPQEMDWMTGAYELEVTEKLMPVKVFTKKNPPQGE